MAASETEIVEEKKQEGVMEKGACKQESNVLSDQHAQAVNSEEGVKGESSVSVKEAKEGEAVKEGEEVMQEEQVTGMEIVEADNNEVVEEDDQKLEKSLRMAEIAEGKRKVQDVEDEREAIKEKNKKKRKRSKVSKKENSTPVTPASNRPKREKCAIERFAATASVRSPTVNPVTIKEGPGTKLKDIPKVAYKLSKKKSDENLQILHNILFGKKTKIRNLKKNIGMFSGYVWDKNKEEYQRVKILEKIDKCLKEKLLDFCDILNIPVDGTLYKEELAEMLFIFLLSPHATTDDLLVNKKNKSKNRKGPSSVSGARKSAKKRKASDGTGNVSDMVDGSDRAVELGIGDKRSKRKPKAVKKTTAKSPRGAAKYIKGSSSTRSGEGTSRSASRAKGNGSSIKKRKTAKRGNGNELSIVINECGSRNRPSADSSTMSLEIVECRAHEPNEADIHFAVMQMLKEIDFDTVTIAEVHKLVDSHFGMSLAHRSAEVRRQINHVLDYMIEKHGGKI